MKNFVVVDNNLLGMINTSQPNRIHILSTSAFKLFDRSIELPAGSSRVRPAMQQDVEDFMRYTDHLPTT